MVNLTINHRPVAVPEGTTILKAAESIGVHIPTLCYWEGLNEVGACRACMVEVEGMQKLAAACVTKATEGMSVLTDSSRARLARKTNVELILSQHNCNCAYCARSGNCSLQKLSNDLGVTGIPFAVKREPTYWDPTLPLQRDAGKCIKCLRCIQVCEHIQTLGVWDLKNTGSRSTVAVREGLSLTDVNCALCGQCVTHCPVGALQARDDTERAFKAIADPDTVTVVQIAPAVRGAWGQYFGMKPEEATVGKMVASLKAMGIDYVFDTDFSADMTIMEEGSEFLQRLSQKGRHVFPMFTSCCPGWVRFLKSEYPDMLDQLSTAKSPQQMFGALIKYMLSLRLDVDPSRIFVISIMPCMAKKGECELPDMYDEAGNADVDLVLTTREFVRMLRARCLKAENLAEEPFDAPFAEATGAGVIFGTTGGVMEAALRSAYFLATGELPGADAFSDVRGEADKRIEASFKVGDTLVRTAVVSGLGNARALIEDVRAGRAEYDFVEVMACPGGCAGGGGQPISLCGSRTGEIADNLRRLDKTNKIRFSHENPDVQTLYREVLGKPGSHLAHKLLHTDHHKK